MQQKLVRIVGREMIPGRPGLYGTTKHFLEVFGLTNLKHLPTLSELDMEAPAEENKAEATETPEAKTAQEKPKVDEDLPLSVEEMFGIRLQPAFIERLSDKGKTWLAKAMINMLIADKVIDQSEMCYLEDALSVVKSDDERASMMEPAKNR